METSGSSIAVVVLMLAFALLITIILFKILRYYNKK